MAGTRSAEMVELLGGVPVFSTLERSDLERIAQLAVPRDFEPGEVVFREGDSSDTCYVVSGGRARAIRSHRDGRTITLATFGPGDIFGELALFEDERRSATVEAIERTSVLGVLGPDMRRLMNEHAEISALLVVGRGEELVAIVPTRRASDGTRVVALPKGHMDRGETPLQAAQREVREETGILAEPVCELGEARYWYRRDGQTIPKSVSFFLFSFSAGDISEHDPDEIEEVRWIELAEAQLTLSHAAEREMVA